MSCALPELIDIPNLQKLMDRFHDATGIPVGVIGREGEILVATGWQEICTGFHRCHPVTAARCRQSDDYIKSRLSVGNYVQYKCRNGLWDLAAPIVIAGEHCATLFLGQFFYDDEEIDEEFFLAQGRELGFDADRYLAALRRIPVFTRERVLQIMGFYTHFVDFLVNTGLAHCRQVEAEKTVRESEKKFAKAFQATPTLLTISSLADGRFIEVNEAFERICGYGREESIGRTSIELGIYENTVVRDRVIEKLRQGGGVRDLEIRFRTKTGELRTGAFSAELIELNGEQCLLSLVNDITASKGVEAALRLNEARLEALARLNEMGNSPLHEITDFALAEAVRLTKSSIGYLAFTNDDETLLTMYSWSQSAVADCAMVDKPAVYLVENTGLWGEAIRQRQPVITNDYSAPDPCKKGCPPGHLQLRRHMNAPIFDGGHIAMVAGVGNKVEEYDETDVRQLTLLMNGMWRLIQRKRMDEALRESEERYRMIVETASEGVLVLDRSLAATYINGRLADILGYCEAEMIGRSLFDFIDGSSGEEVLTQTEERKKGIKGRYEALLLRKNGEKIWASISASPIFDQKGAFDGSFAMISDINARKLAEEKLRASKETLRVIFNSAHDAIFTHELDGGIIDVNDKMLEMYGGDRPTAISSFITDGYSGPDNHLDRLPVIWEKVAAGEDQFFEWQARRIDDGSLFDVEVSLRRITLNQRDVILATVRDITARKQAEEEIEILNTNLSAKAAELEASNRELEAFNYTVSHDLRSPLTNISSCSQAIQELWGDSLDEQCRGFIGTIYQQTVRMDQLIETLMSFSRLARSEMSKETVDLTRLAQAVATRLQMNEPKRRVSFVFAQGVEAQGDARLIDMVLENLIGNAWKYTGMREAAVIEFGVTDIGGEPAHFVRDNGAGFDMAYADRLFLPFQRLPGAEVCKGFGIGLATTERIIRRHGGKVWGKGEPGKGACIYFTL